MLLTELILLTELRASAPLTQASIRRGSQLRMLLTELRASAPLSRASIRRGSQLRTVGGLGGGGNTSAGVWVGGGHSSRRLINLEQQFVDLCRLVQVSQ